MWALSNNVYVSVLLFAVGVVLLSQARHKLVLSNNVCDSVLYSLLGLFYCHKHDTS